ncbi:MULTISPECIES: SDR family NAD(P)-dependent oxidoreductase [Spongiibacter]|uniref:SDR family NAD(P)-dependent oxidoreductase n=1 Tax=Spongiibacter TaxID=630749 RepID=UPI000C40E3A1|nr:MULTISPECIES: SDR family NAD(P)-dependent oxidoreductase [Spongiibacter]MBU72632.1 short-chain dehydrogenase [Spongiibacter sp.]|tara:strand:+ start:9890 stop:10768 length:879 start_codon:yes stop_codon:yes gene_type:complete
MQSFKDKVVVVTGGASGIGKSLARAFLGEGAKVVISDVEQGALDRTASELSAQGGALRAIVTDVSKPDSVNALADAVFEEFGACHVLCNNAGVSVPNNNVWDTTPNDWQWVLGVNLRGIAHGIQAFVPRMLASGEEGIVMNTSSGDGGISPLADQSVYASSKAGVSIMTECLNAQLVGQNTRLRACIFYPSGGILPTGIWTTKRNRPAELAREKPAPDGAEMTFDEFMSGMKDIGIELPVQDLDELAQFALNGLRAGDFVIMIGRESMEETLVERARKLARGQCPIEHGLHG